MPDGVCDDKPAGSNVKKPPERSNDSSCVTFSIIVRDTLSHHFNPRIPASEEASTDSTT